MAGAKLKILSLDGGGVRGIISAQFLVRLEQLLQESLGPDFRLGDYFDVVAGTSTGGIITSLLLLQDSQGQLVHTTQSILDIYLHQCRRIFDRPWWHQFKTLFGLLGPKFANIDYDNLLQQNFGEATLKDLKSPSIICSYDTYRRACIIFKQHFASDPAYNFYLRDIVRATSAAPTYFAPVKIESLTGEEYSLVDGGIYANNPAMCAFIEVNKIFQKADGTSYQIEDIKILSIGTGEYDKQYAWSQIKNWGVFKWISPFIDLSMSATNEVTDYQLRMLYSYAGQAQNYLRINAPLNKGEGSMDNTHLANLVKLKNIGDQLFDQYQAQLRDFIAKN